MNPEIMKWLEIFHISLIGATIPAKIARAVSFPLLAFLELGKNFCEKSEMSQSGHSVNLAFFNKLNLYKNLYDEYDVEVLR